MKRFNRWWLRGWTVILGAAIGYELIAFSFELRGIRDYPTLSTILVTVLGQGGVGHGDAVSLLDALTVIAALVLLWHWHDLNAKLKTQNAKLGAVARHLRNEMQRVWNDNGLPDDMQNDFVTRDKR